ncbi:EAL domain-containing protein [Sphingomonas lenta]|uniref:EAL domain-containing protein n=1 Tax=Sphingomonas lenta TaxID=1141887 RepID=UPI001C3F0E95|nr:EAL domain-containing protein [Sphingomonas lenta]
MTDRGGQEIDVLTLLAELPAGVALFGEAGELREANDAFRQIVEVKGPPFDFRALFGAEPDRFAAGGGGDAVVLGGRHHAVAAKRLPGLGWLVHAQEVTAWVEASAKAREAAARDPLTGLPNRLTFMPEIARAVADVDHASALLMIDLDRFKGVNDTLGYPVGDALLRKVSDRLQASLRATDTVARLGGDEFAVLQTGVAQPAGAETLAKRLVEVLGRPYVVDGHMIDIGASVGVSLSDGCASPDELVKQGDIALYRAKLGGRGRYCFFEGRMDKEMQDRRALELDLRRALALRQFELHYQPQMELETRTITGMEALIRWRHPTRGLVPPSDFIPLAEETGLIVPIGEWVLRQACADAARWPADIAIAVNVSAKQLATAKLVDAVRDSLDRSGLSATRLEIEITESVLMSDLAGCVSTLHKLRELGCKVSMDDFGTGYSSLSYLRSFPFDKIKIDQSFVRSGDVEKNAGIVRAITAIGKHLGMTTIAEGVETATQLGSMRHEGCGSVQGYLISKPVPADEVAGVLDRLRAEPPREERVVAVAPAPEPQPVAVVEQGLYRLVYYSRNAIWGLDEEVRASVQNILAASRRNNAEAKVSGALMFTDGYFAQVLEGDRAEVERVFERIQLDDRHSDVQLLSFEAVPTRVFPTWSMAFVGNSAAGREMFGHYASTTGFDFGAADGDAMVAHLKQLLVEEDQPTRRAA